MSGTEEEKVELEGQQDGVVQEPEGSAEPSTLAEAFAQYRARNTEAPEPPVPATENAGDTGTADSYGSAAESAGEPEPPVVESGADTSDGGFADGYEEVDYGAYRNGLIDELGRAAYNKTVEEFKKQGIQKISVSQLYQRDEDRGTVTFINPDNPDRPFESRADAQAFCDVFNKDVDTELIKAARAERDRLIQQYRPSLELMDFAPKFDTFDETKQAVLDDLVEPYEIRLNDGRIIGYRCDLDAMAAQADKIIEKFHVQLQQQQEPAKNTGSEPALDMKSHGAGGGSGKAKEPKTLEEAMRMVQQEKGNK